MKRLKMLATSTCVFLLALGSAYGADQPRIGQAAPAFDLPDHLGKRHRLQDYAGHWVVLYFYPKNDTPGCTKEACSFRDDLFQIEKLGANVIGASVDDSDSHARFARKYNLPFPLLVDREGKLAESYGALTRLGPIKFAKRHTFLIDPQGKIARIYLSVDTSRHSQEIIDDLKQLTRQP